MNRSILWTVVVLFSLEGYLYGTAQISAQERMQYQIGQRYESMGDFQNALEIYLNLLQRAPNNYTYFDAVTRCYIHLKRFDELIGLIQAKLKQHPNNLHYRVKLGDAFLRKGDQEKAIGIWEQLLQTRKKEATVYRLIANAWMQNRQFDKGIEIYERGRKQIGVESLFSLELAQLYAYRLNYDLATKEYLRYLRRNPRQLSYVQARLAAFKGDVRTYEMVTRELKRWINREPESVVYRRLYINFLITYQNYQEAYNQVKRLEELKKRTVAKRNPGQELFNFGRMAMAEEQFTLAEKAFTDILRNYPDFRDQARIEYELGRTYYLQKKIKDALTLFNLVGQNYPKTTWALQALLTRGEIFLHHLFELDSAAMVFQQVVRLFPRRDERANALLALGDVEIARNNLDRAEGFYTRALNTTIRNGRLRSDVQIMGRLRLAQLAFYRSDFPAAKQHLQKILQNQTKNFSDVYINDALELLILIDKNADSDPAVLKTYAGAMLLSKQNRIEDAVKRFQTIVKEHGSAPLAAQALYQGGQLKAISGDYLGAVFLYQNLVQNYPTSSFCDLALWQIGQIYERDLKNLSKAIETYETILMQFPESLLAEKARKKIRKLEGNL